MSSILDDVKHMCGIVAEERSFDLDIINFINGEFATLTQLGVGPAIGFQIESEANQWEEFYTDPRLNSVKTYLFLTAKLAFDPPGTGFVTASMERQILELKYRLNVVADYG